MELYVIYDKVADETGPIFEAKNSSVALRNVAHVLKDSCLTDYKLIKIGSYSHDGVQELIPLVGFIEYDIKAGDEDATI